MRPVWGKRQGQWGPAGKVTCHPARLSDPSPTCESSCQKPSDNTYVRMHVCAIHRISKKASEVIEYGRCILAYLLPCVSTSWSHSGRRRLALSSDFVCVCWQAYSHVLTHESGSCLGMSAHQHCVRSWIQSPAPLRVVTQLWPQQWGRTDRKFRLPWLSRPIWSRWDHVSKTKQTTKTQ